MNSNNFFADIVDLHPSRIAVYNQNGDFLFANKSYIEAHNIDISDKKNLNFDKIKSCDIELDDIHKKLSESEKFSIKLQKNSVWFESIFSYTNTKDIVHISSDITVLKEVDKKIYYNANYDSLTTLPNRSYFKKQLRNILKESSQNDFKTALLFIDVDKFKEINDTYGHNVGDKMLTTIAKRLSNSVRKDDVVARIGGDEFVIIVKNIKNIKNAEQLVVNLQNKIRYPIVIDKNIFNVTLSIGVSVYPEHGTIAQDLVRNADIAMYEVKKTTKDSFKIYDKFMSRKVAMKLLMQTEIRRALKQDEFVIHYQPIVDLNGNFVVGSEALVKWHSTERGVLEQDDFLEFILSGDMEKEFGFMIVSKVFEDLIAFNKLFPNEKLTISINIFNHQLLNLNFYSDIENISKKYDIDRSQIELKIVESQIVKNISAVKENIINLYLMGFKIVLDGFGIEYSSLNHLKNFKIDKLKIDRSFIKNIVEDQNDLKITKSIINTAKLFDMKVQADGIETKEQYLMLKDIGCHYSQGLYHSDALPREDFIKIVNNI